MAENSLIAAEQSPEALAGAGVVEGVFNTGSAIADGNWAEGLIGGAGAVADAAEVLADPLAGLAAAGFGWLMEHVSFLKEPLDALTGDQQAITAMSETWKNIGTEVQGASEDLGTAVKTDTEQWRGPAVEAYRPVGAAQASLIGGVAGGCTGAATAVEMCGIVLKVVREIVRDLISKAVGELVAAALEWAAAEVLSLGMATPAMVADLVRRAVAWANRIKTWTDKITQVFKNAWSKLDELGEGVRKVKDVVEKIASKKPFGEGSSIEMGSAGKLDIDLNLSTDFKNGLANNVEEYTAKKLDGEDEEQTTR